MKELPLPNIGSYTKDNAECTEQFLQLLNKLSVERWTAFNQEPSKWHESLEKQREELRKEMRIRTAYKVFDEKHGNVIEETFNGLGLDRERGSEQLKELSRAIRAIVGPGQVKQIVIAPTGYGKTLEMLILALALRRIDGASKVIIALMTEYEVW